MVVLKADHVFLLDLWVLFLTGSKLYGNREFGKEINLQQLRSIWNCKTALLSSGYVLKIFETWNRVVSGCQKLHLYFFYLFLIEGYVFYSIVLVSTKHQPLFFIKDKLEATWTMRAKCTYLQIPQSDIKMYTLNMYKLLYVDQSSIKLFLKWHI